MMRSFIPDGTNLSDVGAWVASWALDSRSVVDAERQAETARAARGALIAEFLGRVAGDEGDAGGLRKRQVEPEVAEAAELALEIEFHVGGHAGSPQRRANLLDDAAACQQKPPAVQAGQELHERAHREAREVDVPV